MLQTIPYQSVVLQISLHRVQLHHRIADGRTCCENRSSVARDFVQIAALHKEVA